MLEELHEPAPGNWKGSSGERGQRRTGDRPGVAVLRLGRSFGPTVRSVMLVNEGTLGHRPEDENLGTVCAE